MQDYYICDDDELHVKVPSYLHPKKQWRHYFVKHGRKNQGNLCESLLVTFESKTWIERQRDMMLTGNSNSREQNGMRRDVLRQGFNKEIPNAPEILVRHNQVGADYTTYSYQIIFEKQGRYVSVRIHGVGGLNDLEQFEQICHEIVTSIQIKPQVDGHLGDQDRIMADLKTKREKKGNAVIPVGLPTELGYLNSALTELSRFDPETLNEDSIEAGNLVESAIKIRVKGLDEDDARKLLKQDCKSLKKWMGQHKEHQAAAGFAYGFINGFLLYGGFDQIGGA